MIFTYKKSGRGWFVLHSRKTLGYIQLPIAETINAPQYEFLPDDNTCFNAQQMLEIANILGELNTKIDEVNND